jgi:glutathione synthase/RimK-type ligase-like ATP-grasp enzyme
VILLWGHPEDPPIAAVARELRHADEAALTFDASDVERVELDPSPGCPGTGRLVLHRGQVDLGEVGGIYLRPRLAAAAEASLPAVDALLAWTEMTAAVVVNRFAAGASNNSKPYQSRSIAREGFAVPDTLITTDADAALEFWAVHGDVVYKSISGMRSIVSRLDASHRDRLADVASCPVQFQQYVEGIDYRVHVVGRDVFVCRVRSPAVDYRYAAAGDEPIELVASELPDDVATRCVSLAARLGIELAGIDLRLDRDGRWWCFEVNTAPGFTWYEQHTQLPIAAAVAAHLTRSG